MLGYFSAASQRVIEAFAATMGVEARAAPDNSYGFELARSGVLSLIPTPDADRILVCLARDARRVDASSYADFVKLTRPHLDLGTMLHAAIGENGTLMLAASIDEPDLTIQRLDQTVSTLVEIFTTAARAVA